MLRNWSQTSLNTRWEKQSRKDVLTALLQEHINKAGLKTRHLKDIDPAITANQVSDLRDGVSSSLSTARLEALSAAFGLIPATYNPSAAAA